MRYFHILFSEFQPMFISLFFYKLKTYRIFYWKFPKITWILYSLCFPLTGMDNVQKRGAPLPGNTKENWGNRITVIWRKRENMKREEEEREEEEQKNRKEKEEKRKRRGGNWGTYRGRGAKRKRKSIVIMVMVNLNQAKLMNLGRN